MIKMQRLILGDLKILVIFFVIVLWISPLWAQPPKKPVIVNGDRVEFLQEEKAISAEGNVEVIYEDTKLTCNKIRVNTETKLATAEGSVKLESSKGTITGDVIEYNFEQKSGRLINAQLVAPPFYGKGALIERLSEQEVAFSRGYVTTCDRPKPHWKLTAKSIYYYLGEKVEAKNVLIKVGDTPVMYLPYYVQPLNDRRPRVTVVPGRNKEWGGYLLTAWRYYFSDDFKGRINLDVREKTGFGSGVDLAYRPPKLGKGILRTYYTNEERDGQQRERYRIQERHRLDIDERTQLLMEYNLLSDSGFLKDYYAREYEKEPNPWTYFLLDHTRDQTTSSIYFKKRVNKFFTDTEYLPQLSWQMRNSPFLSSPVFYKGSFDIGYLEKNTVGALSGDETLRIHTDNKFTLPRKFLFLDVSPYVGLKETFYRQDQVGETDIGRTIFYTGIDLSSKFFRNYYLESDLWGLDIHGLRHIITPSLRYNYQHQPTHPAWKLATYDAIDPLQAEHDIILGLENKLQTRRDGAVIDLLRFLISSDYQLRTAGQGSSFQNVLTEIEAQPFSWLTVKQDTRFSTHDGAFEDINTDFITKFKGRTKLSFGHRYQRGESSLLTSELLYKLSPQWSFRIYERFEAKSGDLQEQEYSVVKDLHCWLVEFNVNKQQEGGLTFWVVFRLKAFPDAGFDFNKGYSKPTFGPQDLE